MSDLEPITRKEQYLNRLTGEEQAIPETPVTRIEQYLAKLCGVETEIPSSPITREETYLAYLNGEDVTLPEPITRLERFMAFAAGESETKPTPLTREEYYWDKYQGGAVLKDFPGLPASIVTVTDALAKPLDSLKVAITPVQSGSGDPSPDNIRPISGWTECNIRRNGKNLFDQDTAYAPYKTADNTYLATGSQLTVISIRITSAFIGKQVTFSAYVSGDNMPTNVRVRAIVNGVSYSGNSVSENGFSSITFIPETASDAVGITYGSSGEKYITVSSCQLEIGSERTAYEPYTGTTYSIAFPSEAGTVYGGTLDVTNGTLTVDRRYVDLGYFTWTQNITHQFYSNVLDIAGVSNRDGYSIICSAYKNGGAYDHIIDKTICLYGTGNGRIWIYDTDLRGTATEVKEALTGYKCVYELATPITYQLTPTEVQMLLGTNNL